MHGFLSHLSVEPGNSKTALVLVCAHLRQAIPSMQAATSVVAARKFARKLRHGSLLLLTLNFSDPLPAVPELIFDCCADQ